MLVKRGVVENATSISFVIRLLSDSSRSLSEIVVCKVCHVTKELIDQFVSGLTGAEAVNAAFMAFKKTLIGRALDAEFTHHLGCAPGTGRSQSPGTNAMALLPRRS